MKTLFRSFLRSLSFPLAIVAGFVLGVLLVPLTFVEQVVVRNDQVFRRHTICAFSFNRELLENSNNLAATGELANISIELPPKPDEIAMTISFSGRTKKGPAFGQLEAWMRRIENRLAQPEPPSQPSRCKE